MINEVKMGALALGIGVSLAVSGSAMGQLVNDGFETWTDTTGLPPDATGFWRGDVSQIVTATPFITPFEGVQMLNLINTHRSGPTTSSGGEVWQIIDVSPWSGLIQSGNAVADASSWFNRMDVDAETDTEFAVSLYAYRGEVDTFFDQWKNHSELGMKIQTIATDTDTQTWESAQVSMSIPEITDFIVLRVSATENVFNDESGDEFDGHFADGSTFNIVPAPTAAMALMMLGGLFATRRRR